MVIIAIFLLFWVVKAGDSYGLTSEAATQKTSLPMIGMGIVSFIAFPVFGILLDKWDCKSYFVRVVFCGKRENSCRQITACCSNVICELCQRSTHALFKN